MTYSVIIIPSGDGDDTVKAESSNSPQQGQSEQENNESTPSDDTSGSAASQSVGEGQVGPSSGDQVGESGGSAGDNGSGPGGYWDNSVSQDIPQINTSTDDSESEKQQKPKESEEKTTDVKSENNEPRKEEENYDPFNPTNDSEDTRSQSDSESVVEEEPESVKEEPQSVKEELQSVKEEPPSLKEEPESVKEEQPIVNDKEEPVLNKTVVSGDTTGDYDPTEPTQSDSDDDNKSTSPPPNPASPRDNTVSAAVSDKPTDDKTVTSELDDTVTESEDDKTTNIAMETEVRDDKDVKQQDEMMEGSAGSEEDDSDFQLGFSSTMNSHNSSTVEDDFRPPKKTQQSESDNDKQSSAFDTPGSGQLRTNTGGKIQIKINLEEGQLDSSVEDEATKENKEDEESEEESQDTKHPFSLASFLGQLSGNSTKSHTKKHDKKDKGGDDDGNGHKKKKRHHRGDSEDDDSRSKDSSSKKKKRKHSRSRSREKRSKEKLRRSRSKSREKSSRRRSRSRDRRDRRSRSRERRRRSRSYSPRSRRDRGRHSDPRDRRRSRDKDFPSGPMRMFTQTMKEVTDDKEKYKPRTNNEPPTSKVDTFQHLHDIASGKVSYNQTDSKNEQSISTVIGTRNSAPAKSSVITSNDFEEEIDLSAFGLPSAFGGTKEDAKPPHSDWNVNTNTDRAGPPHGPQDRFNNPRQQKFPLGINLENKFGGPSAKDKIPPLLVPSSLAGAPLSTSVKSGPPPRPLMTGLPPPPAGLGLAPPAPPPTPPGRPPPRTEVIIEAPTAGLPMSEALRPRANMVFAHQPVGVPVQPAGLVRPNMPAGIQQQILLNPMLPHPLHRMPQFTSGPSPRLQFQQQTMAGLQNVIVGHPANRVPATSESIALTAQGPQPPEFIVDPLPGTVFSHIINAY